MGEARILGGSSYETTSNDSKALSGQRRCEREREERRERDIS